MKLAFQSTKTYGHEQGLSCVFRQHPAERSHCRFLHGYALKVSMTFQARQLDQRNWVVDFGGLKDIKAWLQENFDHKLVVAQDDPHLDELTALAGIGVADTVVVPAVGCEAFAQYIFDNVQDWCASNAPHAILMSVTVAEHDGNAATVCLVADDVY